MAVVLCGCGSIRADARQEFRPGTDGVLTVATTLPAPGFWDQDASGTVDGGFEFEVATALADRCGLRLDVVDVPFEQFTAGDLGGADLALSQISITDGRADHVDFSTPYHTTSAGVLGPTGTEISDQDGTRADVGGDGRHDRGGVPRRRGPIPPRTCARSPTTTPSARRC